MHGVKGQHTAFIRRRVELHRLLKIQLAGKEPQSFLGQPGGIDRLLRRHEGKRRPHPHSAARQIFHRTVTAHEEIAQQINALDFRVIGQLIRLTLVDIGREEDIIHLLRLPEIRLQPDGVAAGLQIRVHRHPEKA